MSSQATIPEGLVRIGTSVVSRRRDGDAIYLSFLRRNQGSTFALRSLHISKGRARRPYSGLTSRHSTDKKVLMAQESVQAGPTARNRRLRPFQTYISFLSRYSHSHTNAAFGPDLPCVFLGELVNGPDGETGYE